MCVSIHLQLQIIQLDEDRGEFVLRATFDHPYPTTKIMWIPDQTAQLPDLVATSGDYLRLWRVNESQVRQECMLNNVSSAVSFSTHKPGLLLRLLPAFLCCMLQHLNARSSQRMRFPFSKFHLCENTLLPWLMNFIILYKIISLSPHPPLLPSLYLSLTEQELRVLCSPHLL